MTYTKTAILASVFYATASGMIAMVMLYYTGLTSAWQFGKHIQLSIYLWLINFLLINLMFWIANFTKPPHHE